MQTPGSCPEEAMMDMIHPENMHTVSDRMVAPEFARTWSHSRWFVQPSANCRNLSVASARAESSFQPLTSGTLIAI
jgi:hypothetical protein